MRRGNDSADRLRQFLQFGRLFKQLIQLIQQFFKLEQFIQQFIEFKQFFHQRRRRALSGHHQ